MSKPIYPEIPNWIDGCESQKLTNDFIEKLNPHNGSLLYKIPNSSIEEVSIAVNVASNNLIFWSAKTPIERGCILSEIVDVMKSRFDELVECISIETGKSPRDAKSEVNAAIMQGAYWAGEGMRLYGRSLTSGMLNKHTHTVRQPRGVAGLIVPANTPIANIAWKVFPALICGNTVVLKAAEDAPKTALLFAQFTKQAGLPNGVLNVIQGYGSTSGAALVQNKSVSVVSFTGSTEVGRWIAKMCGDRLARVSLELGGKNPFVVCDDANIDQAVHWAVLSAFSNAGQRCAAGSRILVFENIYAAFRQKLLRKIKQLKLGTSAGCDIGPVINRRNQLKVLAAIEKARAYGGDVLCGGDSPKNQDLENGFYIEPTIIEFLEKYSVLDDEELFGPVATIKPVKDLDEAISISNSTAYGLTSAIHTSNIDRALWFSHKVKAGVANVNLGTFGSEPHMPFGGFGLSGNGTREPGIEALDVYSELKNISILVRNEFI